MTNELHLSKSISNVSFKFISCQETCLMTYCSNEKLQCARTQMFQILSIVVSNGSIETWIRAAKFTVK